MALKPMAPMRMRGDATEAQLGRLGAPTPSSDASGPDRTGSCSTVRRMSTLTIRTDPEVERALESLTQDGRSRSEAVRAAILVAERETRRSRMRAEAEALRDDPEDLAASRELAAEMDALRAW